MNRYTNYIWKNTWNIIYLFQIQVYKLATPSTSGQPRCCLGPIHALRGSEWRPRDALHLTDNPLETILLPVCTCNYHMPKRRATSPAQPASVQTKTVRRTDETGDVKSGTAQTSSANDDHGNRTPTRGADDVSNSSGTNSRTNGYERHLSALAPEFVPRPTSSSASNSGTTTPVITKDNVTPKLVQSELSFSGQPKTQPRQMSKGSEGISPSKSTIRPVFKSEPLQIKDSTFQARLFSLESPSQITKILAYMRRQYPDFQHHMSGWRCLVLKPGMTGLEGEEAFEVQQGWDDDGEKGGGKAVVNAVEKMGLCDIVVIVSRRCVP